ncbi:MAG: hypothetical protein ACREX4_15675 [Gammaproteobacteria bacterium]
MDTIEHAKNILKSAESALRKLIETGLKEQRYADVAEIATIADGVAKLLRGRTLIPTSRSTVSSKPVALKSKTKPLTLDNVPSRPTKGDYPRFERDGDRLVKVGWSKKSKDEYEHRAPRESVIAFVHHIASRVKDGQVFEVERLLPVLDAAGDEIPAYQVYMTLAWLRDTGTVEKKGRDGYVLRNGSLVDGGLDKLWATVPARSV